jgi:hypothetical protein
MDPTAKGIRWKLDQQGSATTVLVRPVYGGGVTAEPDRSVDLSAEYAAQACGRPYRAALDIGETRAVATTWTPPGVLLRCGGPPLAFRNRRDIRSTATSKGRCFSRANSQTRLERPRLARAAETSRRGGDHSIHRSYQQADGSGGQHTP